MNDENKTSMEPATAQLPDITIEHDIPIPAPRARSGKWKNIAAAMIVGDSVVINSKGSLNALYKAGTAMNRKMTSRSFDENGTTKIRIWRTA